MKQSFRINSQDAPDFLVTDSWGTTHCLYKDYLDLRSFQLTQDVRSTIMVSYLLVKI